ncbi:MAG: phage tail tape measure protein [Thermoplasmatota archaeon]
MGDVTARLIIEGDTSGAIGQLHALNDGLDGLTGATGVSTTAMSKLGLAGQAALGATLGILGVTSVQQLTRSLLDGANAYIETELAFTRIGDAMHLSAGAASELQGALAAAAQESGAGIYTNQQVALALAGVRNSGLDATTSVDLMRASMNLATATGDDLATTTSDLSLVLRAWHLDASQAASVAGGIFGVAGATGTNTSSLLGSVGQAGALFQSLGYNIQDTTALLGILQGVGVDSMNGITSALVQLEKGTGPVAKELDALNVSAFDSLGKLKEFPVILAELQAAGMKPADALGLFGVRGAADVNAVTASLGKLQAAEGAFLTGPAQVNKVNADIAQSTAGTVDHAKAIWANFWDWLVGAAAVTGLKVAEIGPSIALGYEGGRRLIEGTTQAFGAQDDEIARMQKSSADWAATLRDAYWAEQGVSDVSITVTHNIAAQTDAMAALDAAVAGVTDSLTLMKRAEELAVAGTPQSQFTRGLPKGQVDIPQITGSNGSFGIVGNQGGTFDVFSDAPGGQSWSGLSLGDAAAKIGMTSTQFSLVASQLFASMVSSVPHLASGGVVNRPTLALIGESGPEAVTPLSGANAPSGAGDIHIHGSIVINGVQDVAALKRELNRLAEQEARVYGGRR